MASSSIRQPDDVLTRVASPLAAGRRAGSVREQRWNRPVPGARTEVRPAPRRPRSRHRGCRGDCRARPDEALVCGARAAAHRCAPEGGQAPGPRRRRSCERDRRLLFGEPIGQLGGRGDLCLELGPTIRRERSVCERSKLGDLLIARSVSSTASHGHDGTNGSSPVRAGGSTPARSRDHDHHRRRNCRFIALPFRCRWPPCR